MSKPDLVYLYDAESDGVAGLLEIDRNTNELYFNKQRVITDITLNKTEKRLAWTIAVSTVIIAICNVMGMISSFINIKY